MCFAGWFSAPMVRLALPATLIVVLFAPLVAPTHAKLSSSVAGLTVWAHPAHATIDAFATEADWSATLTPDERHLVPVGEVVLEASAPGYEGKHLRVTVRNGVGTQVSFQLRRRTRARAALRSLLFPSWGQFYNGDGTMGKVILAGTLAGAALAGFAQHNYRGAETDYEGAIDRYRADGLPSARDEADAAFSELDDWHERRQWALVTLQTLWVCNVLQAYIAGPPRPLRLSLRPSPGRSALLAAVSYRF